VKRTLFLVGLPLTTLLRKSGKNIKYMSRMQEIALEVDHLKQQLRERERERAIVKWLILAVNTYSLGSDNCSYYES
jgi:hypothetical protein